MSTPNGWQNLTTQRRRAGARHEILPSIKMVHPDVFETPEGDMFAYWLGSPDLADLVGIAWKTGESWTYAFMNRIAVEAGVHCTLLTEDGRIRIVPTLVHKVQTGEVKVVQPENTAGLVKAVGVLPGPKTEAMLAPAPRKKYERNVATRRVYQDKGLYYVDIESKTHFRQLGPFKTRELAEQADV